MNNVDCAIVGEKKSLWWASFFLEKVTTTFPNERINGALASFSGSKFSAAVVKNVPPLLSFFCSHVLLATSWPGGSQKLLEGGRRNFFSQLSPVFLLSSFFFPFYTGVLKEMREKRLRKKEEGRETTSLYLLSPFGKIS